MALVTAFFFPNEVLIEAAIAGDSYTEKTYAAPVSVPCMITGRDSIITDAQGRQMSGRGLKVILGIKMEVSLRDRVTFTDREPKNPLLSGVEKVSDESGWHHSVLYFS